jgi:hypothetical protein
MQCRGEDHASTEDPEEGALRPVPLPSGPGDYAEYEHARGVPGRHRSWQGGLEKRERALHEPPMFGIRSEARK